MKGIVFPLFLFVSFCVHGQTYFEFTTLANRKKHDENLINNVILRSIKLPLSSATEAKWIGAFWAMELALYETPFTKTKIAGAWKKIRNRSESFQKALLEVSYTLYPGVFDQPVFSLLKTTPSSAIFIRCAEYLLLSKNAASLKPILLQLTKKRYDERSLIDYSILLDRLQGKNQELPPLVDLFSKDFLPGQTIIYSLQRSNRDYAGLVLIRDGKGNFVKDEDGEIFTASQLARSISNYPFYITNGNTPQGVFRWTGFDTSTNSYIGPTPNLQMVMPVEAKTRVFFEDEDTLGMLRWNEEIYLLLLPSSWHSYRGIYESYRAGQIGRSEIIMHGTTINPAYYKGQPYFPQTPSLGCLCSYEEWNNEGKRIASKQQRVVDALKQIKANNGYVVVIDLDNKKLPVTLKEILPLFN